MAVVDSNNGSIYTYDDNLMVLYCTSTYSGQSLMCSTTQNILVW